MRNVRGWIVNVDGKNWRKVMLDSSKRSKYKFIFFQQWVVGSSLPYHLEAFSQHCEYGCETFVDNENTVFVKSVWDGHRTNLRTMSIDLPTKNGSLFMISYIVIKRS